MVALLIAVVAAALIAEHYTMRHALDGVEYDTEPDRSTVEIDAPFNVITTLRNTSRRIIPFLRMTEDLPRAMKTGMKVRADGTLDSDRASMKSTVFLMPRQQLSRSFEASLPARGRYYLRGATLYGGDFLGLKEIPRSEPRVREIVVLPSRCDSMRLMDMIGGFLGDISVKRFILEDPVLTLGFREYSGREPMRDISWTQTLRTGNMMVKNYDHTTDVSVSVVLNVYDPDRLGRDHVYIEKAFSMTRSVAEMLEAKGISYSFYTNAVAAGTVLPFRFIPDGLGSAHLGAILEGLGRATYDSYESFGAMAERLISTADNSRAVIVITGMYSAADERMLSRIREMTGGKMLLLRGDEEALQ